MAQDYSVFSNIQDNRTSSLAEQVADQINQVIIDQNINAGEKLPNEFELAARLKQQAGKVIAKFMQMGEMHAINDVIDFDTAALLAEEFHAKVEHEVHVTAGRGFAGGSGGASPGGLRYGPR